MKTNHTPAPWHLNAFNLAEVIVIRDGAAPDGTKYIDGRHQERVAMVGTDNTATWNERYANALLIAAAPELLEALENLVENYESRNGDMGMLRHFIEEGRAVIDKASIPTQKGA